MYASVRFSPTSASASKDIDNYYSVNSILLQFIPGAHEINKRDIILKDSCPRNVVVDADSHQPFIIDIGQYYFKDQLFKDWEHFGFGDGREDWTPEGEWSESVRSLDNSSSIGLPMQSKLEWVNGFLIDIKYPK
ncbi:serine threonine kinase fnkB [Fusarium sp. NRRL 25303]|nr:serine threonine kinase fnkB [Fusarium sp. NRRL 25303]